jgi:hypothetical protein
MKYLLILIGLFIALNATCQRTRYIKTTVAKTRTYNHETKKWNEWSPRYNSKIHWTFKEDYIESVVFEKDTLIYDLKIIEHLMIAGPRPQELIEQFYYGIDEKTGKYTNLIELDQYEVINYIDIIIIDNQMSRNYGYTMDIKD